MTKRNWLVTAIVAIIVLIVLAAGGYGLYRLGYAHGAQALVGDGELPRQFMNRPFFHNPAFGMREWGRGFMPMMPGFNRFTHFGWFGFLFRIAVFGVVVALAVWLIITLSRRQIPAASTYKSPPEVVQPPEQTDKTEN